MSSEISSKDARKSKKKSSSSSNKKPGGPELFVLPPHILQKLGINLGNIKHGGPNTVAMPDVNTSTTERKNNRKSKVKNKNEVKTNNSEKPSKLPDDKCTIMETADLMKKSVFLSPTFVTTDNIDRELELSTVSENDKGHNDVQLIKRTRQARKAVNVTNKKQGVPMPPEWDKTVPAQSEKIESDIVKVSTSETHVTKITTSADNTIDATLTAANIIKDTKSQLKTTKTVIETFDHNTHTSQISEATDEHLDEAYLSDCSNSNLGAISAPISPINSNKENKVKIIHEEVFDLSTYNKLVKSVFSPDKGSLIPVPINSVVSVQAKPPGPGDSKEDLSVDQSLETDERFIEQICREVKTLDDININMLDVICDDNYVMDESSDTTKMQNNNFDNLILYVANDMPNQSVDENNIRKSPIEETKTSDKEGTPNTIKEMCSDEPDTIEISELNQEKSKKVFIESITGSSTCTGDAMNANNTCQDPESSKPFGNRILSTNNITNKEVKCNQESELTIHPVIETSNVKKADQGARQEIAKTSEPIEPLHRKNSSTVENKDKVVEIASYLSKYLQSRRSSSSRKNIKKYENRKKKINSKMDKSADLPENIIELTSTDDINIVLNTTVGTIDIQSVEESCMWLNHEFGKLCYTETQNSLDDVYYWGEKSSGSFEDLFEEVDYVEYVTSTLNNWMSDNKEGPDETKAAVGELDDNPVVVIVTEAEPTPSLSKDQALVDAKPTDSTVETVCLIQEETNRPESNSVDVEKSDVDEIPVSELRKKKKNSLSKRIIFEKKLDIQKLLDRSNSLKTTSIAPEIEKNNSQDSNENHKRLKRSNKTQEGNESVLKSPTTLLEKDVERSPVTANNTRISRSKRPKKEDTESCFSPETLRQSIESELLTLKTEERAPSPPPSLIDIQSAHDALAGAGRKRRSKERAPSSPPKNLQDISSPSAAHSAGDASAHYALAGRKRRSRRIISSSDEGTDAGDPSYASETVHISVQDFNPGRQSARSSKRLRSTLADYSSSDEVLVPKKLKDVQHEVPGLNLDSSIEPKKRGRKKKKGIVEELTESSTNESHKLKGDCNHNETADASNTNCDTNDIKLNAANLKLNTSDVKLNTSDVKLNTSDVKLNTSDVKLNTSDVKVESNKNCDSVEVECGVCNERLPGDDWIDHIAKKHEYLAWKKGDTPVDLEDPAAVKKYLITISKEIGGFTCYKCGDKKKYPLVYRKHMDQCVSSKEVSEIKIGAKPDYTPEVIEGQLTCAQCGGRVSPAGWQEHSLTQHYNLAWPVGGEPINIRSPLEVSKYLKIYTLQGYELECKVCGAARASLLGFYAHILTCGKAEAEVDAVMDHCEICDKKYLCIYKTQHEAAHRDKLANEMRRALIEEAKREAETEALAGHAQTHALDYAPAGRRRKAAEKARTVIMELEEVKSKIIPSSAKSESESDGSDAVVPDESDESDESDFDSDASQDEYTDEARRSHKAIGQSVFSFKCQNIEEYTKQGFKDFCTSHYTKDTVFPEWVSSYSFQSDEPPGELSLLDTSCQIKLFGNKWTTFEKFQSFCAPVQGLFLGAAPSCLAWAPPQDYFGRGANYLAVGCFNGADAPRLQPTEMRAEPALLQIWNFHEFHGTPKLSIGIILPATAWAMSWCPAGGAGGAGGGGERLGLLAVTCADGGAYIYGVPTPDSEQDGPKFCKLKPVGELRLSANKKRKRVHATAIHWSMQNCNSHIMVGYADGVVAHFDLESESPLTRLQEDGISVFLPYHQERAQAGCITGVCHQASSAGGAGVAGWTSTTGSAVGGAGGGVPAARTALVAPSGHAQFLPGWGAMVVTTDDLSVSELNVWGGGRALRLQRPLAVCARCACAASASGARLRCLYTLPHHVKTERHNVLNIEMAPLQPPSKRIKQTGNTEQEMKIEPLTYEAAVAEYGVQIATTKKKQNFTTTERDDHCERFPLADMTALAFCPAARHHRRLAIATHAGFVIVIDAHS